MTLVLVLSSRTPKIPLVGSLQTKIIFPYTANKVDLIFGCASFPSSNSQLFAKELSYLNSNHRPPKNFSCHPIARLRANYKRYKGNEYNDKEIFRSLPPLIKAYIRAGAWIGEGAVCDHAFNTTDVLVVLNSRNIIKKYSNLSI